jgi:hypothetical protein
MRIAAFLFVLFCPCTADVFAQSLQTVKSRDGSCQVSVPSDWAVEAMLGSATSKDKKVTMTVSSPKMIDSFAELKQAAHSAYTHSAVTKDSATEFEMTGQSITGKPDVYRAIPLSAAKFCITEVIYESGTAEDARKLADTLKAAH